jgi:transcriptional regulator with XRE-family HTH domain
MPHRDSVEVTMLEALRVDRGLTLTDAADQAGVAYKTLKRYEQAETTKPQADVLERLARFYNVRASTLLDDLRRFIRQRDRDRADDAVAA